MLFFLVLALVASSIEAYLPGQQPRNYEKGELLPVFVNKIWSPKTQLPYSYYSLPFCRPDTIMTQKGNIGQILVGDSIQNSDYELFFDKEEHCKFLCTVDTTQEDIALLRKRIEQEYFVNWIADELPAIYFYESDEGAPVDQQSERCSTLGCYDSQNNNNYYLYNHITFLVYYSLVDGPTPEDDPLYRVVGFEVHLSSIDHGTGSRECLSSSPPMMLTDDVSGITYTYSVDWRPGTVDWANRWNAYFYTAEHHKNLRLFGIMNSLMIVLLMSGMIAMIMLRYIYRDIARYNEETNPEDAAEEFGWKLVHGDVFRPPAGFFGPMFLSVFVGSGMQVFAVSLAILFFAVLGFLSPANQGSLIVAFVLLFVGMGSCAGYVSARLYKMFKGKAWKRNTFLTAFSFTGSLLTVVAIINIALSAAGTSLAIPFKTLLLLITLWLGICAPLVATGAYFGFKAPEIKHPVRVTNIPRQVPTQPWYLGPWPSILIGGLLPFGAIAFELQSIMNSIWLGRMYNVFGSLFIVLIITAIICAEISIVMTYFQLCSEDYNWWWRSFLTPGASAFFLFINSILYFVYKLEITGFVSVLLYFGYMGMLSWCFFLMTGAIGFVSSLAFVNRIYSAIKVD